eukprot:TRINITY_DN64773_c0_g1_i1.p1 TRINITY_DN64773_c0_g1~~TRINITY_DN64773_c0_g1_i1.p1  ORF type:complete len:205 (-),score=24.29 TRINITY_DN64773_c0_g1_i1:269-883(-)
MTAGQRVRPNGACSTCCLRIPIVASLLLLLRKIRRFRARRAEWLVSRGPVKYRESFVSWHDDDVLSMWVNMFIHKARSAVGKIELERAQASKDRRDGTLADGSSEYHITMAGAFEHTLDGQRFSALTEFQRDAAKLSLSQASPLGMGLLREDDGNFALMVVVEWPELQVLRRKFDLPPNYPHITVGFAYHDIHNQPKDRTALLP